ncbi:MAG: FAD-dependent oxidoreductase, partial [Anaerolineae bacterium]|nr:FAD-dependent oxidoreductase [Anaerolineae bacterium]
MAGYDYDLVVIGCGPAGEKGAARAAYFGKRVAVVERAEQPGGAGINTGTVPSKTLRETALYFSGLRQRGLYGIDYSLREGLTIRDFMYRKQIVVENEWGIIGRNLERHGIELVRGSAALAGPHTVRVTAPDGAVRDLSTEFILIATGSAPLHPPEIPFDGHAVLDSDTILQMDRIPRSLVVVGGGVIGCEYASIFTALGVRVTLVDGRGSLLTFIDGDLSARLQAQLELLGLRFIFNTRLTAVERAGEGVRLALSNGGVIKADAVLVAAGRQSNSSGLGLEAAGVALGERGLILVNEQYQTSVPNIYAAGDVIGFPALASASMEQARVAMAYAFGQGHTDEAGVLPFAIYTIPEIAMAGLSEDECRA